MRMTEPELALALDDDIENPRPPSGARDMSEAELVEYADWLRSRTPRQRLQLTREGKL